MDNIILNTNLLLMALIILICFFLVMTIGYLIGKRHHKQEALTEKREKTAATLTGAMLALLGFMLAISLSMADSKFQERRKLILDEANAISTSMLRAKAIGGVHGTEIVRLLENYTRLRLEFFAAGEDPTKLKKVYEQTQLLQKSIWDHVCAIAQAAPTPISSLLLSSLNEVFDLGTSRRWVLEVRIPPYVIKLLLVFSLSAMGIMGYYFGICGVYHPALSGILFVALTFIILLIMDLDRPRSGYIKPEQSPLTWLVEEQKPQIPPAGSSAR
jgi:putative Mn2+ efflux pump MntP